MGLLDILRDQRDFETQWLGGAVRFDMASRKIQRAQFMGGKCQRGLPCLELAVGSGFMQKTPLQPNARLKNSRDAETFGT
jgi:hypothetical protein